MSARVARPLRIGERHGGDPAQQGAGAEIEQPIEDQHQPQRQQIVAVGQPEQPGLDDGQERLDAVGEGDAVDGHAMTGGHAAGDGEAVVAVLAEGLQEDRRVGAERQAERRQRQHPDGRPGASHRAAESAGSRWRQADVPRPSHRLGPTGERPGLRNGHACPCPSRPLARTSHGGVNAIIRRMR